MSYSGSSVSEKSLRRGFGKRLNLEQLLVYTPELNSDESI